MMVRTSGFASDVYRAYNIDLGHLSDEQLREHFHGNMHEPRIYGATFSTVEALSMRWLRGDGIEIGAGASPTPLYGNATSRKIDSDDTLFYGGDAIDMPGQIDSLDFAKNDRARFDFAVASHVLEHADSFIRAIENMVLATRPGGIVYIILPDINLVRDKAWMPNFDFEHHIGEYRTPLVYTALHDQLFIEGDAALHPEDYKNGITAELYQQMISSRRMPPALRFMYHKHDYSFNDWLRLFMKTQDFLGQKFRFMDVRYGHERSDCHFVLQVI